MTDKASPLVRLCSKKKKLGKRHYGFGHGTIGIGLEQIFRSSIGTRFDDYDLGRRRASSHFWQEFPRSMQLKVRFRSESTTTDQTTIRSGSKTTATEPIWQMQYNGVLRWFKQLVWVVEKTQGDCTGCLPLCALGSNSQFNGLRDDSLFLKMLPLSSMSSFNFLSIVEQCWMYNLLSHDPHKEHVHAFHHTS